MSNVKRQIRSRLTGVTLTLLAATAASLAFALVPAPVLAAEIEPCPNQAVREQQHSTYLPDCRAYELATPPQKEGVELVPANVVQHQVPYQAAAEGAGIAFATYGGLPGAASGGGYLAQDVATSSALGSPWQTQLLDPESRFVVRPIEGEPSIEEITPGEFDYYSPSLSCGVESTAFPQAAHAGEDAPQLAPGETTDEAIDNLYLWEAAADSYTLITNIKPENPVLNTTSDGYLVRGASDACEHVIFRTSGGDPNSEYRFLGAPEGSLYEYDRGTLRVASILPDGTPAALLAEASFDLNQISSDGSHVFFEATADKGADAGHGQVFVRLNGTKTIEASASTTSTIDGGAEFKAASESGEQVFFTANYGLTASSSSGLAACNHVSQEGCDLYDYDVADGTLTDISADVHAGEPGDADTKGAGVDGVLGISEEGTVVYFSATGQLVPGQGNTEAHDEADNEANVYVDNQGTLSYVASIGNQEGKGVERGEASSYDKLGDEEDMARVSSDGGYLLFSTVKPIVQSDGVTYDNSDAVSDEADAESYEYALASGSLTCVSCDPDGARPDNQGRGVGLSGPYVAYDEVFDGSIPRNLSNSGEVFFQSASPLVAQASNGTLNVYGWQPAGLEGCGNAAGCVSLLDSGTDPNASYFAGASANGENVYITTYAQLVPGEPEGQRSVYDVRVDGGFLAPPQPAGCQGEECQGPPTGQEGVVTPASSLPSTNGNLAPPAPAAPTPATPAPASATLTILKHSVKGDTATILASVSSAGKVVASGSDLSKVTKSPAKAKTVTLKLKLTKRASAALARHPKKTLSIQVKLVFTTNGGKLATTATVSFGHKKTKTKKPKRKKAKA